MHSNFRHEAWIFPNAVKSMLYREADAVPQSQEDSAVPQSQENTHMWST